MLVTKSGDWVPLFGLMCAMVGVGLLLYVVCSKDDKYETLVIPLGDKGHRCAPPLATKRKCFALSFLSLALPNFRPTSFC